MSEKQTDIPKIDLEAICTRNRIEARGFVAVGGSYDGSQRYIDTSETRPRLTTNVYGNRP